MMRTARFPAPGLWLLWLLGVMGCGAADGSRVPVRGLVAYRGVPLTAGLIVFAPDISRGNNGPLARGEVQPDGTYELQTAGSAGAYPGWYRVTVVALESPPASSGQVLSVPRSLLPDKYRDPELSGLVHEVKPGRENHLDFHLE